MEVIKRQQSLNRVISAIKNGGVVICPTDTVYGFIADAMNAKAVEKIYKIKRRPKSKPLAIFVRDLKMAKEIAKIDNQQERRLRECWPGKYTFILKSNNILLPPCVSKSNKIALRIPKYKFLNDLLKKINIPLAQTSVNISGEPPIAEVNDIFKKFTGTNIAIIVDAGNLGKNNPSKIYDLTFKTARVLRN